MHKIWILFKREYNAAVKTKSFIISLILVPIMMGGSFVVIMLMDKNQDTSDQHIVVMDHSGLFEKVLEESAELRNSKEIFDPETGDKTSPAYLIEFVKPDPDNIFQQKLELSKRVRDKELHAFVEVGKDVMNPGQQTEDDYIRYYSEHGFMDNSRYWFSNTINNYLRQLRVENLNLPPDVTKDLFTWIDLEGMGLVDVDKKTGQEQEAEKLGEVQSFLIPYIMVILMFMLTMMSAVPLLTAVMEEKSERIAEVLLGTITPFQFMMGKVLGGLGISLTTAAVYVAGAIITAKSLGADSMIPYNLLPWLFVFTIMMVVMVGSGMAALGATCNDSKDAQSLQFPAMLPVILPMFIMMPIIQNPMGSFATTFSLIPPFTPTLMMMRMATPVTIPLWQPIVGLLLVVLFTIFSVWIGSRIFRTAILIQGQKPSLKNLVKYAFRN